MSWNYRVVRCALPVERQHADKKFYYVLCEVYYDEHGSPNARTERGATFGASDPEGPAAVGEALQRALRDATERPVLDEWDIDGLADRAPRSDP